MSCSFAVCNSPVFSPSSSSTLFCNKPSILCSPQETISLTLSYLKPSPSSPSAAADSPFRLRYHKPPKCFASACQSPPGGVLKRKRPMRLDIPICTTGFVSPPSELTATPREESGEVEREGDGYSVYCKRGRREAMEDRFSAITKLRGDPRHAMFGVYDGHGGVKAAEFAAKNLDKSVLEAVAGKKDDSEIADAVKRGYLATDAAFLHEKDVKGGSCCVTAMFRDGNLVVSNAGCWIWVCHPSTWAIRQ